MPSGIFRISCPPTFEPLSAIGEQGIVIRKEEIKTIFGRRVQFTIVVAVLAASLGPLGIDTAPPISLKMETTVMEQQVPGSLLFINLNTLMGDLPE